MGISRRKAKYYYENIKKLSVRIPWNYFCYVLKRYYDFEMIGSGKTSGSKRVFINGEIRFTVDEPHAQGDKFVHKVDRKNAIRAIEKLERISEMEAL